MISGSIFEILDVKNPLCVLDVFSQICRVCCLFAEIGLGNLLIGPLWVWGYHFCVISRQKSPDLVFGFVFRVVSVSDASSDWNQRLRGQSPNPVARMVQSPASVARVEPVAHPVARVEPVAHPVARLSHSPTPVARMVYSLNSSRPNSPFAHSLAQNVHSPEWVDPVGQRSVPE